MPMDSYALVLRWAHVLAAIVAVGGLFFARFGLLPALQTFDEATRNRIHEAIRGKWLPWVIGAISLLLVTGLLNFLLFNARVKTEGWNDGFWMKETSYHALFGAKFLLAMAVFYFASALVGRGEGTQWIRNNRARWFSITLALAVAAVLVSGWMRQLHTGPNSQQDNSSGVRIEGFETIENDNRYKGDEAGSSFREEENASPKAEL